MRTIILMLRGLVLAVVVATLGVGCAASPAAPVDATDATVIDVRTPAEYAEGHLEGAVNLDLQSASFATAIADLPADGSYIVYCRSGNRSAQAVALMRDAGFTTVVDAGGLDAAAKRTGLPVVTR